MKNLHFEDSLGDHSRIEIDFYKSKESRILELEREKMMEKLQKDFLFAHSASEVILSQPVIAAISQIRNRFSNISLE